jgi:potassium channel LctB
VLPLMGKKKTLYNLMVLFLFYINVILTFAIIYWILDIHKLGPIINHYAAPLNQNNYNSLDQLLQSLYFSAITLLSVGYGDLTPFGWSKAVAIIEAMIGYTLPAALVIQYISPKKQIDI